MFHCCRFNSDVSNWNLPNLRNATAMFDKTLGLFNDHFGNLNVA